MAVRMGRVPHARPVTVMVVDDHAGTRLLLRTLFEDPDAGLLVVAEADGATAAVEAIAAADPDVVVLDARMPVVDGFEAAARIRALWPAQRLVLLTGLLDEATRARAAAAGVDVCLSKDDLDGLAAAVRAAARPA